MSKYIFTFLVALLFFTGCSKNAIFPTDTNVYGNPDDHNISYTQHYFKSSDEAVLRGWYFRAKGPSLGMIVVANGMRYNMSSRFEEWTWVTKEGYDLFIFDYRGYGVSDDEVDMFGFVDDVSAAINYAHTINSQLPMIVVGQSMGGSFVIDAMAKKPYPYVKLLVIDATMKGFSAAAESLIAQHFLLWPLIWVPSAITPKGVDSIDFVDKTKTPTLFIVGLDDSIIPPEHSVELYDKAKDSKALWVVEGAEHVKSLDNTKLKDALKIELNKAVNNVCDLSCEVRYFEKNNKPKSYDKIQK